MTDKSASNFRDQFLAAEPYDPALRQKYQLEVQAMFERKLTAPHRVVYVITGLLAVAFVVLFSTLAVVAPKGFPPLVRVAFGVGVLFSLGWAVLSYRILRRGSVLLRNDSKTMAAMVWVFMVIMITIFMVVSDRAGDHIWGVKMVVEGLVFFIGAAVFLINTVVQDAQMRTQEKLLEIEYRLAELSAKVTTNSSNSPANRPSA
jgi:hypothetical protein